MELKDTVEMMLSEDYKEHFKAEYYQVKIRLEKLEATIKKYDEGILNFTEPFPIELLRQQADYMNNYKVILKQRASYEGITL